MPVRELGNVFLRLLDFMSVVPSNEIIMLSKIDLSDGFWRMIVDEESKWNFAYVLPEEPGQPTRLVVPSALQMGWTESPGYFCAATETARDIVQGLTDSAVELPPHEFEPFMDPERQAKRRRRNEPDLHTTSVFVDDFILGAVENHAGTLLGRISRAALHGIHSVFPPASVTGHTDGKDPISLKKLKKGDARWDSKKEILGFMIDGLARTVQLTESKTDDICNEIRKILKKNRVAIKRFRSLVGKIRHAAACLPSLRGFFSPLNKMLQGDPKFVGLGINSESRAALLDIRFLIRDLANRPTHVNELVPGDDHYVGYCDACATGAGGVWFSGSLHIPPLVWRVQFPRSIADEVVSFKNPTGRLTNSDLELAGLVLHYCALENATDLAHKRVGIYSDNTPTVHWTKRMADRSQAETSGRLLRGFAMRQRTLHSGPTTVAPIAGDQNGMADEASRIFNSPFPKLSDSQFLPYFNKTFPLPQLQSWTVVHPPPEMISAVMETLEGKRLPMQRWTMRPETPAGKTGSTTPWSSAAATHTSKDTPTPSNRTSLSVSLAGSGQVSTAEEIRSELNPWKRRSATYHKPSCWQDSETPGG
jgi:hypothetical protein